MIEYTGTYEKIGSAFILLQTKTKILGEHEEIRELSITMFLKNSQKVM